MKSMKTTISLLLTLTLLLTLALPAFALGEMYVHGRIFIQSGGAVDASQKDFVAYRILELKLWGDENGTVIAEQARVPANLADAYAAIYGVDREAADFDMKTAQMVLKETDLSRIIMEDLMIPFMGSTCEGGYEFRNIPLGYYILKDTTRLGAYATPVCELMLVKVAPEGVVDLGDYFATLEVIATDPLGNRLGNTAEFALSGDEMSTTRVEWDEYILDEQGTYWKLRNGAFTTLSPDSIVDGMAMDPDAYDSLTDKYTKETHGETIYADKTDTVTGTVGDDGVIRFVGLMPGQYCVTNTLKAEAYEPLMESTTVIIEWGEAPGEFIYHGDVGEDGRLSFVFVVACGGPYPAPGPFAQIDPNLTLRHSLNITEDISLNYIIPESMLEGYDMESLELYVEAPQYEGNSIVDIVWLPTVYEKRDGYCYFTLTGLNAVQMNDEFRARLSGIKDGEEYASPIDVYSVVAYALSQLNKSNTSPKLKTLCADLLRYGAMAQSYKGYRTDALADEQMTSAHKAYLTDLDTVTFGNRYLQIPNPKAEAFRWTGKGLNLEARVSLTFRMEQTDPTLAYEDWKIVVYYQDKEGKQLSYEIPKAEVKQITGGDLPVYQFSFSKLAAADLRSVVCVTVYDRENNPLSSDLIYSADTYGNGKTGTLGQLCKALFAYSDSARAYLAG